MLVVLSRTTHSKTNLLGAPAVFECMHACAGAGVSYYYNSSSVLLHKTYVDFQRQAGETSAIEIQKHASKSSLPLSVYIALIDIYIYVERERERHILCICFNTLQAKKFEGWKSVPLRQLHPTLAEDFDKRDNVSIAKWLQQQNHYTLAAKCMKNQLDGKKIFNMTYETLKTMDALQEKSEPSFKTMVTACNSFRVCKKTLLKLQQACSF